jgi:hypothetical protein
MRVQLERILKELGAEGLLSLNAVHKVVRDTYDVGEADFHPPDGRKVSVRYDAVRGRLILTSAIRAGGKEHDGTQKR